MVENLSLIEYKVLKSRTKSLYNKIHEGLVGVCAIEYGILLTFRLMLGLIIYVDVEALRSLIQSLQTLRVHHISSKDVSTAASYINIWLLLLQNFFAELLTNTLGLLHDIMCLADNEDFVEYI